MDIRFLYVELSGILKENMVKETVMDIRFKRFIALMLVLITAFLIIGCDMPLSKNKDTLYNTNDKKNNEHNSKSSYSGTHAPFPATTQAKVEADTWTVMIYMNGSDLETKGGEASKNLESLLSVEFPDRIRVLIYTGGTFEWQNELINANYNQIWTVDNEELVLLESMEPKSIGESDTLAEFISYAQSEYPADKKALFFWNHGAGSIEGFGADELYDYDALWLSEMESAFSKSSDGEVFDVIGFDACLMASIETASVLEPYADILVASEEVAPGGGWDYEYIFKMLAEETEVTAQELGIAVARGYYQKYEHTDTEGIVTCSVIDLNKVPALEDLLGWFAAGLTTEIVQPDALSNVAKARLHSESYGEEPGAVSYDMIDLYDFVNRQRGVNPDLSAKLMKAIDDAVIYEVSGLQRSYSYGLSIYFPFAAKDHFDYCLGIYRDIDFCPEYQEFVADFATKLTNETVLSGVPKFNNQIMQEVPATQSEEDMSELGSYFVELSEEEMAYMSYVYCSLGWYQQDGALIDLGFDSDLVIDYDTNTIRDNFGGWWTGLNGQPVAVYVMEETEKYVIYNIPVMYNGEKAVVKGAWIWDETYDQGGYYTCNGVYYTNDEYSAPCTKISITLGKGDEITPIYTTLQAEDGYEGYYEGETFLVDEKGLYLELIWLPAGYYRYGFMFLDNYGNKHFTDFVDYELFNEPK